MFLLERANQLTSPCWAGSRASHQSLVENFAALSQDADSHGSAPLANSGLHKPVIFTTFSG
jgi:hypothetical protein